MKSFFISIAVFLLLCGAIILITAIYLFDLSPHKIADDIYLEGRYFLYKYDMVEKLSNSEVKQLYLNTCTRKCHSRDVIENHPRTAPEWEWVVARMKSPDRADIADRHAKVITKYLQENYLSNVPTVLPEQTMRFVKRHLWKNDFGESDLYFDIIYVPRKHLGLLPYLIAGKTELPHEGAFFIIYINTHQGVIPPWNLAEMATLHNDGGQSLKASTWQILYEDGQRHHVQGILSFPSVSESGSTLMDIELQLPGVGKRVFQWNLPIPVFSGNDDVKT